MDTEKADPQQPDPDVEKAKTSPKGMAPDKSHAGLKSTGTKPDVETEEIFNNSPNNSDSGRNRRLK